MKIFAALLIAAVPAFASGSSHGGGHASARGGRAAATRVASRSAPGLALRSFAAARFAPRTAFFAPGASARSTHALSHLSGLGGGFSGHVPLTGGSTASRGNAGPAVAGTMMLGTAIGGPGGLGSQTVAAGAIAQNPAAATNVGRSAGVSWGAPLPVGGAIGGTGATTNSAPGSLPAATPFNGSALTAPMGQGNTPGGLSGGTFGGSGGSFASGF
ncbi:MAG: hypothetical protein HKL90_13050 [Elusimicrobia bacterium]|nr:hypothetical protein [Elusimicrobiota bacterium]